MRFLNVTINAQCRTYIVPTTVPTTALITRPNRRYAQRGESDFIHDQLWIYLQIKSISNVLNITYHVLSCQMSHDHFDEVIRRAMVSQINSLAIVHSTVYSGVDQRKHQSSASLAFVRGIHRWPVNSPHKGPETPKMFPFDDVIMCSRSVIDNRLWLQQYVNRANEARNRCVTIVYLIVTYGFIMTCMK